MLFFDSSSNVSSKKGLNVCKNPETIPNALIAVGSADTSHCWPFIVTYFHSSSCCVLRFEIYPVKMGINKTLARQTYFLIMSTTANMENMVTISVVGSARSLKSHGSKNSVHTQTSEHYLRCCWNCSHSKKY